MNKKNELLTTITYELPTPPNRANDSGGWQIRAFEKQKYLRQCEGFLYGKIPKTPFKKVTWRAHVQVSRLNDADNLVARLKWCLDALVTFRIINNDDAKHCWPETFPTQEIASRSKGKPKTVTIVLNVYE